MRGQVIFFKTLRDLSGLKRNLLYLLVIVLIPALASYIMGGSAPEGIPFSDMTLAMQTQFAAGIFIVLGFIWIAGIPLVILSALTCGAFIASEDEEGTLLLLVSKPVRRVEILAGKFLAFLLNAALLELAGLLLAPLAMHFALATDVIVLESMLSLVPQMFLYSLFVMFVFGAVSLALSSLTRSRTKTIITVVVLAILIFFGFMTARGMLGAYYEKYSFQYIDVNYHLGNAYLSFIGSSGFRVMPIFQAIVGQFTGTYSVADIAKIFDQDIGAMPPSLEPIAYVPTEVSISLWLILAIALLALAALDFERREVH